MAEKGEFRFREWLAEGKRGMSLCMPVEFRAHVRAALREMLLARRALLDAALERLEECPDSTVLGPQEMPEA